MANSADPDQLASSEANRSGSTLFAKGGYINGSAGQGSIGSGSSSIQYLWVLMAAHVLFFLLASCCV